MGWRRGERDIVQEQRSSNGDMRGFIPCCYVVRHITARMRIWLGKRELRGRGRSGFSYVRYERRARRDLVRRDLARRVLRPPITAHELPLGHREFLPALPEGNLGLRGVNGLGTTAAAAAAAAAACSSGPLN